MICDLSLVGFDVFMIDSSKKHDFEGGFWTLEFECLWKTQLFPMLCQSVYFLFF